MPYINEPAPPSPLLRNFVGVFAGAFAGMLVVVVGLVLGVFTATVPIMGSDSVVYPHADDWMWATGASAVTATVLVWWTVVIHHPRTRGASLWATS